MSKPKPRALAAALAGVFATTLVGCTATVTGIGVMATQPTGTDSAIVALLDTGKYPTTAGHPVGTAGSEAAGAVLEAQRMAEYVTAPWDVNAKLRQPNFMTTGAAPDMQLLKDALPPQVPDIASAHGVITAFASARTSDDPRQPMALTNLVMRFPNDEAASTAATEMADKTSHVENPPRSPITIHNHPEAAASTHDHLDDQTVIESFTARGPYVLYQGALSQKSRYPELPSEAEYLVESALGHQETQISQFVATDPNKLADLPLDPTGKLLARTLSTSDGSPAFLVGIWQPHAWLHFEDDPIAAAARYAAAGVEVIAQGLTTVYQTSNTAGAARMVEREVTKLGASIKPITGVPGLPAARCFTWQGISDGPTVHEMAAHFRCIAYADRYAYIAYSDTEKDVKQQVAAQYRILAGK